jgi:hypothetical protein
LLAGQNFFFADTKKIQYMESEITCNCFYNILYETGDLNPNTVLEKPVRGYIEVGNVS